MSMRIDSANYLRKFVNFAKAYENDADAIARFGQANNPRSYRLVKTNDDHIRGIFNWKLHGAENATANNQIRQQFILNVLKCLGWDPAQRGIREDQVLTQAQIEEAVNEILPGRGNEARRNDLLKDMKVWDYGKGRPLTSRRISATINRVKAIVESRAPQGDFVVEGKRQFLTGDTAEILAALSPDMFVATPTGDDEPANVGGNGNPPPSDSDPVEFENPSAGFKAGKLPEKFEFQGDKDVVSRGMDGEDDDDIRDLVDSGEEVAGKKRKIPAQGGISVQKNVSDEKDPDPDHLIMKMMKARGGKSDYHDFVLHCKICSKIEDFLVDLMGSEDNAILGKNGISSEELRKICLSLYEHMSDLRHDVPKGNLQTVVRILTKTHKLNVDDGVVRRVLLDVFKAYNEQQKDLELRVVIPEE